MIRKVFLAFLAFGLVACGDSTGPESDFGIYTLQTVNGEGLPAVVEEIGTTFLKEITAGSITLNEDLTCSFSLSERETEDGDVTTRTETLETDECTYTIDNGVLTLTVKEEGDATLSIIGSAITLIDPDTGDVYIFEK